MGWFKPTPADDRPREAPDAVFDAGWQHNTTEHDERQIKPFLARLFGRPSTTVLPSHIPDVGALDGAHFRIGYQGYFGVSQPWFQESESERQIGMPLRLRPPIIPRRVATINGVRDAIVFVQSQPGNEWRQPVMPRASRR